MKSTAKYWIETFLGGGGYHYWRVRSRNGQILLSSESYYRRSSRDRIVAAFSLATGLEVRNVHLWGTKRVSAGKP